MREIKFRFVSRHKKTEKLSISYNTLDEIENQDSWQGSMPWVRIAVEQYTGIKDKNVKEIYEGDIIKLINAIGKKVIITANDMNEIWQQIGNIDKQKHKNCSEVFKTIREMKMEIIGNIHENPGLLEEDKR